MKAFVKNITNEVVFGRFTEPYPKILAYKEKGMGNVGEKIKSNPEIAKIYEGFYKTNPHKYKDYVLIEAGEKIETKMKGENILGEPRLKIVKEGGK